MTKNVVPIFFLVVFLFPFDRVCAQTCSYKKRGTPLVGTNSVDSMAMSADGSVVALGSEDGGNGTGYVRVYAFDGQNYVQRGQDLFGEAVGDEFGGAVAISSDGSVIAVGAIENTGGNGHVRVFGFNGEDYVQRGFDVDGSTYAGFGFAIAMNTAGSIIAVGAQSSTARVFQFSGSTYTQLGSTLVLTQQARKVAMNADGSIVAVGVDFDNSEYGSVSVYAFDGSNYILRGNKLLGGEVGSYGDRFGSAIDMSNDGSVIAISATGNDNTQQNSGHVRVFEFDSVNYVQRGGDIDGEGNSDFSGNSIALSSDGSVLAVGAKKNDGVGTDAGHVRVFRYNGTNYVQVGADLDGEADNDEFGISLAMSADGSVVAVGSSKFPLFDEVSVFDVSESTVVQNGPDLTTDSVRSGASIVLISEDGSVIAASDSFGSDGMVFALTCPTAEPTSLPTTSPTLNPSTSPTAEPTLSPSSPSSSPTPMPTATTSDSCRSHQVSAIAFFVCLATSRIVYK